MPNLIRIFLVLVVLGVAAVASAQEALTPDATQTVNLDEDVQPTDLGISEPKLLPDSPFYFLKNWARDIQQVLTFDPVKKAELRLKFANEKLMEVKEITQKTENPEIIQKAAENYQQEIEKIKNQVEKIKEKAKENSKVESFLDKFINQQVLHQKLLQKLENEVPSQSLEKIKEVRESQLEDFCDVMLKLEDQKEKITEKLDKVLKEQKGSQFKNFKNLEVLKNLEEKVPEEAKGAIQKAEENAIIRLQGDLEKMSPEDQEKFKDYIEKISGEKEKQLEILENLKSEIRAVPETPNIDELIDKLEKGTEKLLEKIEKKAKEKNCPPFALPAIECPGRWVLEKSEIGCPIRVKCIISQEEQILPEATVCINIWDPVCGKDGKTYSNKCFAKLAGIEIAYSGECREKECETDADCPQLKCALSETVKCVGLAAKCVKGRCEIQQKAIPILLKSLLGK